MIDVCLDGGHKRADVGSAPCRRDDDAIARAIGQLATGHERLDGGIAMRFEVVP